MHQKEMLSFLLYCFEKNVNIVESMVFRMVGGKIYGYIY